MKFNKVVKIDGTGYHLFDIQRSGDTAIYKNDFNYLRIGLSQKIEKDLSLHKKMEAFGFPVAKLLGEGKLEDQSYFIEESLGENHFGEIFKNDTKKIGHVSNQSFDEFLAICTRFATAQLTTCTPKKNWDDFQKGVHLDIICSELVKEKEKILDQYKQTEKRLAAFPFGVLHGDFTPFNIYPKGIIDLEDSFQGPVGFDLGSMMEIQNWFPEFSDDEFHRIYKFTGKQKTKFIESIDNIYLNQGLPKISDYSEDFNYTKGIWFTVRMHQLPKLQQYRYDLIRHMLS